MKHYALRMVSGGQFKYAGFNCELHSFDSRMDRIAWVKQGTNNPANGKRIFIESGTTVKHGKTAVIVADAKPVTHHEKGKL